MDYNCDEIKVCDYCNEEIQVISAGDELLDYCESCQQLEPDYHYVTQEYYEEQVDE